MTVEQLVKVIDALEGFVDSIIVNSNLPSETAYGNFIEKKVKLMNEVIVALDIKPEPKTTIQDVECPECGSKMIARANRVTGEKFWGCKNYPDCRGTRDSEGKSKEDRKREKDNTPPEPSDERFRFRRG